MLHLVVNQMLLKYLWNNKQIPERLRGPFQARQSKQSSGMLSGALHVIILISVHLRSEANTRWPTLDLVRPPWSIQSCAFSGGSPRCTRSRCITCVGPHHKVCCSLSLDSTLFIKQYRKRRRVLKNNERLAHAKAASVSPPEDVQDQGFTRPSVLVLLPFRSSALAWLDALTTHTPSPAYQIENHSRFLSEYALPSDAVDKLAVAEPGTYPRDHVETFKGNVDDNFRVGIKLTRKSVKLFADFYGCDIIFASPLGLRMSIEKEKCVYCANSMQR